MAGIDVGGDSSVEWRVQADHVRTNNPPPTGGQDPGNAAGWIHHGVDETEDPAGDFEICIEIPDNRQAFFDAIRAAIDKNGPKFCFKLPIVQSHTKQISITWKSKKNAQGATFGSGAAVVKALKMMSQQIQQVATIGKKARRTKAKKRR